ncbi:SPW repeat domain-containing protein [Rhizohabitans arisaemae]|uniref:SPW repeat domain-containing protein n=1 Tax=Rhizohabitans arisaemae TaxID=2720610 RepID=UPI0024B1DE7C|nr:SPW repeat protein [Rhizohabitans arisaemae]
MGKFGLQDLVATVAGLATLLAPLIWASGAAGVKQPLIVLGALLAVSGLYGLLGAAGAASWASTAFAVLIFLSPWAFEFTSSASAAWTAWIAGGVAAIVGLWAVLQTRSTPANA